MEHVFAVFILGLHDEKMHSLHHLQFMMIPPTGFGMGPPTSLIRAWEQRHETLLNSPTAATNTGTTNWVRR